MGFVPEADSHCRVTSLPSVSSPSNSHLGFDGLTGKKKKLQRSPDTSFSGRAMPCWAVSLGICYGQLLSGESVVFCHATMLYSTPRNTPTSIPCTHIYPVPAASSGAVVILRGCLRNSLVPSQRRHCYLIGNFREIECDFTNTETGIEIHQLGSN